MKRVLIVEDEPSIALSLEFLMKQQGYGVTVLQSGEAALETIGTERPDLVLLDVMLPGVSGFEVCQAIRERPEWGGLKVVMLTAKGREVDVQKGRALGADGYITKPFGIQEVVETVRALLPAESA